MNVSIQYLVKTVIDSLEGEVLPHLDPQTTPASNVRACLMLLTNIETRVEQEARCLFDDNRELRAVLQDAVDGAATLGLDESLRSAMAAALKQYPPQESFFDAGAAASENREYQELLTQVINRLPSGKGEVEKFRHKLHDYLRALGRRDMQLAEKALARVPL